MTTVLSAEQCDQCAALGDELIAVKSRCADLKEAFCSKLVEALGHDRTQSRVKQAITQIRNRIIAKKAVEDPGNYAEMLNVLNSYTQERYENDPGYRTQYERCKKTRQKFVPVKVEHVMAYIDSMSDPPMPSNAFDDESMGEEAVATAGVEVVSLLDEEQTMKMETPVTPEVVNKPALSKHSEEDTLEEANEEVRDFLFGDGDKAGSKPESKKRNAYLYIAVMGPSFYQFKYGISFNETYDLLRPYTRVNAEVVFFWRIQFPYDQDTGVQIAGILENAIKNMAIQNGLTLKSLQGVQGDDVLASKFREEKEVIQQAQHDKDVKDLFIVDDEEGSHKNKKKKKKKITALSSGKGGGGFEVLQVGENFKNVRWVVDRVIGNMM